MDDGQPSRRVRIRVRGVVQGVGFRPHVHTLAVELGLVGDVRNDGTGVLIDVAGPAAALGRFRDRLVADAPPLAHVTTVAVTPMTDEPSRDDFVIARSTANGAPGALLPPDTVVCRDCASEAADPDDRRHRHPLVACTNCGPRWTIVERLPWDRPGTTMREHPLCDPCRREYEDPRDRRFHAQPIGCNACGPRVRLVAGRSATPGAAIAAAARGAVDEEAIAAAAGMLGTGAVLAVKGVGGWHLVARADDEPAVLRLRRIKHRHDKPFAVMVADSDAAGDLVVLDDTAVALLTSPAGPIVLLPRRPDAAVAPSVAPRMGRLGVFVAPSVLHQRLVALVGGPIVATSGNVTDEPIAFDDEDAFERLGPFVDGLLGHDRRIAARVDDAVLTVMDGAPVVLRRARGFAPLPMSLTVPTPRPLLAVGAQQKSTVSVARDDILIASEHLGDLHHPAAMAAFEMAVRRLCTVLNVRPELVVHDLHPGYGSTQFALDLDLQTLGVQHHHAHVASCLVDNGRTETVIGVAFDGTGYGTDGGLWGGELLVADLVTSERVGHLRAVALPGGERAIREPWRMAVAHLRAAGLPAPAALRDRHLEEWAQVEAVLAAGGVVAPPTTSVGRLFDAVAAMLDVRDVVSYEGQGAIELEQSCSDSGDRATSPVVNASTVTDGGSGALVLEPGPLLAGVLRDMADGLPHGEIASRFHDHLADVVTIACTRIGEQRGLSTVALTGGVFQNGRLRSGLTARLHAAGLEVLNHRDVPPNDGGISIGQAAVAAATTSRAAQP